MIKCWNTKESDEAELGVLFEDGDMDDLIRLLVTVKNRILSARKMTGKSFENYHVDTVGLINEYENKLVSFLPLSKPESPNPLLRAVSSDPTHIADRLNLVIDFLNEKFNNDR